jgi:hypothetical protein
VHLREEKNDIVSRQSGSDFARRHIGPNEDEAAEMRSILKISML